MKMNKIYFTGCLIFFLSMNCFAQKEIVYKITDFFRLDGNGKEIKIDNKQSAKKEILGKRFYITEFENTAFLKEKSDSNNPLRLEKEKSFINSTEYTFDEGYMSWKLKITKYPRTNELRLEMKAPDSKTGKIGIAVFLGEEI
jgi:hypothetical protein